jgi:hypothetical protein
MLFVLKIILFLLLVKNRKSFGFFSSHSFLWFSNSLLLHSISTS